MTRNRGALIVALSLAAAGLAGTVRAQEGERGAVVPNISVQGSGQVRADPDEASVRLGVVAQAKSARAAQERANQVAAAILKAVRDLGVEAKDVQTSQLDLSPLYAQPRPGEEIVQPRITGYQASYTLAVRLEKLDLIGQVIDAGLAAGANQVQGVVFDLRDDRAARSRALEMAVAAARAKAQAIAGALGVRLGEVLEATEGNVAVFTPTFDKRMAMQSMAASEATPIAPGQLTIDASVTVRYRIAP